MAGVIIFGLQCMKSIFPHIFTVISLVQKITTITFSGRNNAVMDDTGSQGKFNLVYNEVKYYFLMI